MKVPEETDAAPVAELHPLRGVDPAMRRKAMLEAVRQMIREGGASSVTMRSVADRLGISTTMLYSEFPDKASLMNAAVDLDFAELAQRLQRVVTSNDNAYDRIRKAALEYVAWGVSSPAQYAKLFMEVRDEPSDGGATIGVGNPRLAAFGVVCELVRSLSAEEHIAMTETEVDELAQVMWECIHGVVSLRLGLDSGNWLPRLPIDQHVEFMVTVLLNGVRGFSKGV